MLSETGKWDVRCPIGLCKMFPVRKGWYYKVNNEKALRVLRKLSVAYHIKPPRIIKLRKKINMNAAYRPPDKIYLYPMNHLKSVFHEFYHHLDFQTNGKYDSSDRKGGPSSLAWIFADKMWEKFRTQK